MECPDLSFIVDEIQASIAVKQRLLCDAAQVSLIQAMGRVLTECFRRGNRILIAGNGGSAADAQHIAAEFVCRYGFDRPGLPALALTTDTSIMTAVANDCGFEQLFRRQIEASGSPGDIFLGISTSGNSANILEALRAARSRGLTTFGMTGESGGEMYLLCDYCLCVPSTETPRIQEAHALIGHTLCAIVELALFADIAPR